MRSILLALLVLCGVFNLSAQGIVGTEFHFAVPLNFRDHNSRDHNGDMAAVEKYNGHVQCIVTSTTTSNVTIVIEKVGYRRDFAVTPTQPAMFEIPDEAVLKSKDVVENISVDVVATRPVAIVIASNRYQTTESFSVLPVDYYGSEYRLTSRPGLAPDLTGMTCITATANETVVNVHSAPADAAPFVKTFTLNKGQSVRVVPTQWRSDLTGARVSASKPVSVITGHTCAYVPDKVDACNTLLEHQTPVSMAGNEFVVPIIPNRKSSIYRIVATQDSTSVNAGDSVYTLSAGACIDVNTDNASLPRITSSKPIQVALFSKGFKSGDSVGDPTMVLVPPTIAWQRFAIASQPLATTWSVQVVITTVPEGLNTIRINGKPVPTNAIVVNNEKHVQVTVPLSQPFARIECGYRMQAFVMSQIGEGEAIAYDGFSHVITWGR